MEVKSTVTGFKGWIPCFEYDFDVGFCFDEFSEVDRVSSGDWFVDDSVGLQPQKGVFSSDGIMSVESGFDEFEIGNWKDFVELGLKSGVGNRVVCDKGKELEGGGGDPHYAFLLALRYLEVEDLLAVEGVCRSLCDAIRGDPLLWRSFRMCQPLSLRVTDEVLAKLTSRAQGTLECLTLVDCVNITDVGLKRVIESNPTLTKLSVPGCIRLTVNGILNNLRVLKSAGSLRVKHLRISGLGCVSKDHFEELTSLLDAGKYVQKTANKPQYLHMGLFYLSCDDDRPIDVEPCPICNRVQLVYDCSAENCRGKDQADQICRGCTLCIPRCKHCGCCLKNREYEETFFFDYICQDCLNQLCRLEKQKSEGPSSGQTIFRREMRYQVCFYSDQRKS